MLAEAQDIKSSPRLDFPLSQISLFSVVINVNSTSGVFPTNKTSVNCHIIVIALLFFLLAIVKQVIKLSKQDQVRESL